MYHYDYVGKNGAVFESSVDNSSLVTLNGQSRFTFDQFLNTFVLIEEYKHPFTITSTHKRLKRLDKKLESLGYVPVKLKQIDFDLGEENVYKYGYYHVNLPNPFRVTEKKCEVCSQTDNLISEVIMTSTGREAFADLRFDVENNELDMEYGLLDEDGCSGSDTKWSSSFKINFCPKCGKKLKGD